MSSLEKFLHAQTLFLLDLGYDLDKLSVEDRIRLTRDQVLHAHTELTEILGSMSWKSWLQTRSTVDIDALAEELVDLLKLGVLNVMILHGISAERLEEMFWLKHDVNNQRFLQHKLLQRLTAVGRRGVQSVKMVAVDLDGVLAAYPENWLEFIRSETGLEIPLDRFSLSAGTELLRRETYSELKDRFRRSGLEYRATNPLKGAKEFTESLRALGYTVVILSARPTQRYKRLYSDSIRWLREYGIHFDVILWDEKKEDRIIRDLPFVTCVVEDDTLNAERLGYAGIKVYLLDRPYNRGSDLGRSKNCVRVESLEGVIEHLSQTGG